MAGNSSVDLWQHEDGVVVPLRVAPGAQRSGYRGVHDGYLKLAVGGPAEKGKANSAVIEWVATVFQSPKNNVTIFAGETSRLKKVLVKGASMKDMQTAVDNLN